MTVVSGKTWSATFGPTSRTASSSRATRDEHGNLLYELTLLSTGARRQSDTNALIQRYNAEIAMAALSDFMLLGHSRVGTFALGVTKTELFATAFSYVLDVIANEINEREIPRVLGAERDHGRGQAGPRQAGQRRPGAVQQDGRDAGQGWDAGGVGRRSA